MKKILPLFLLFLLAVFSVHFFKPKESFSKQNYATFVFPVRGRQFWRTNRDIENLTQLQSVVDEADISPTWLLQYDALKDEEVIESLTADDTHKEIGVFIEVTYDLAKDSYVNYPWESERWERGDKVFLSGYTVENRRKLIDKAFAQYYKVFKKYPQSVGAWHIDSWSLQYMRQKYGIKTVLVCADQYLTDGYQIWGQYWGVPYYPSIRNTLEPAASLQDNIGVLKIQWAMRDPLKGFGTGPDVSNHSTQVNDYARSLKLAEDHFPNLVDTYTKNIDAKIGQITLGLEAGELDATYFAELSRQFKIIKEREIKTVTMAEFSDVFRQVSQGKNLSSRIIKKDQDTQITWYNTPLYRLAVKSNPDKTEIVDLRLYNTALLWDNEYWFKDSRQNLMRLIPAVVDQVGFKNQMEIIPDSLETSDHRIAFEVKDINEAKKVLKKCLCHFSFSGQKVVLTFEQKKSLPLQPSQLTASFTDLLVKIVPDVRYSSLAGKPVGGFLITPQKLFGVDLSANKFGLIHYDYPILEAFKNLRSSLELKPLQFGQYEEQIMMKRLSGRQIEVKETEYGVHNLERFYQQRPDFENSKYIVY
jgi:hypothetical protein